MGILSALGLRSPPHVVVLDCLAESGPRRVEVNRAEAVPVRGPYFEGRVLISHRLSTSVVRAQADADKLGAFPPRRRGLEVQIQGTFVRDPPQGYGLFWSVELGPFDQAAGSMLQPRPGPLGRLKAKATLATLRRQARKAGLPPIRLSNGTPQIRTHAAADMWDIGGSMGNLTLFTPRAAETPPLGPALHAWAEEAGDRALRKPVTSLTDYVVTVSLQTSSLDLPSWRVSVSRFVSFKLKRLIGKHPLHLALFEAPLGEWTDLRDFQYHVDLAVLNSRVHREILWRTPVGAGRSIKHTLVPWIVAPLAALLGLLAMVLWAAWQECPWMPDVSPCREALSAATLFAHALDSWPWAPLPSEAFAEAVVYLICALCFAVLCVMLVPMGIRGIRWVYRKASSRRPTTTGSPCTRRAPNAISLKAPLEALSIIARDNEQAAPARNYESEASWTTFHSYVAASYGYPERAPTADALRRMIEACRDLMDTDLLYASRPLEALAEPLDDVFWGRLLLARDFDVRKAVECATNYLSWRADGGGCGTPDMALFCGELISPCQCVTGEPLLVFRPRYHSNKKPPEFMHAGYVTFMDAIMARHMALRSQTGFNAHANMLEQFVCVIDLEGCGKANWDFPGFKLMLTESNVHFPDMLRIVLLVNVPTFFMGMWSIVKPHLHPRTRNKVIFVSRARREELLKYVPAEHLPVSLGGQAPNWLEPEKMDVGERLGILSEVILSAAQSAHSCGASPRRLAKTQWRVSLAQRQGGVLLLEVSRAGGPPEAVRLCNLEALRGLAQALGLPAPASVGEDVACFSCNPMRSSRRQWESWLNQVLESPEVMKRSGLRRQLAGFLQIKL